MSHTRQPVVRSMLRGALTVALALSALAACSEDDPEASTIERETFIATYVDLRVAALDAETRELTDEARDEVLARHGVTEDDLMTFADVHGTRVEFMRDVWNEVELRLDGMRPDAEPR